jgi:anti-anti-sigma factor
MDFSIGSKYESSSAATISCAGELDVGSCRKLIDAIETVYQPELERLRVDLSEVTFMDSTGIGCLIHADLQCRKQDVRLEIVPGTATVNLIRRTHARHPPLALSLPSGVHAEIDATNTIRLGRSRQCQPEFASTCTPAAAGRSETTSHSCLHLSLP